MSTLPSHPNLAHLRHQARDLLRAADAGDPEAARRIRSVSGSERVTLAGAQLAIAREYGFVSWPVLKAEVEARTRTLSEAVDAFLELSVRGRIGGAGMLLAGHPDIANHDVRTAVALGDAARVSAELERDQDLVSRRDPRTGWTALHLACASRWHVDPSRVEGLVAIVGMLLDAGADLDHLPTAESLWSPLRCAVASTTSGRGNEPVVRLLLERGAKVEDHDLYLAGFAKGGGQWCLRLLVGYAGDVGAIASQALASPISLKDTEGVRVLLEAGADPHRYRDDDGQPTSVVRATIAAGCSLELIELLLAHGADPNEPGEDGRSAYAVATATTRCADLLKLLRHHGARDDSTALDHLLAACWQADRVEARRLLAEAPDVLDRPALVLADGALRAAETGSAAAVGLMLDLGFPIETRVGDDGATLLHAAAYAGSADVVRLLIERGADIEASDDRFESPPLDWAAVGSGGQPTTNPDPDWLGTTRSLLDAGASTNGISLTPENPKPPSREVAELLRDHIVGTEESRS